MNYFNSEEIAIQQYLEKTQSEYIATNLDWCRELSKYFTFSVANQHYCVLLRTPPFKLLIRGNVLFHFNC